jgi:hypothetical protein
MNGYTWSAQAGLDPYNVAEPYRDGSNRDVLAAKPVGEQMALWFLMQRAERLEGEPPTEDAVSLWRELFLRLSDIDPAPEFVTDEMSVPVVASRADWDRTCRPYLGWLRQLIADRLAHGVPIDDPWPAPGGRSFGDWIDTLNRKERYFLFSAIVDQRTLTVSPKFRASLGKAVGISIPEDARAYIDYHLDWIHAASLLAQVGSSVAHENTWQPVARGTQEDIDLVVVFRTGATEHAVLCEAKGVTSWGNTPDGQQGGAPSRNLWGRWPASARRGGCLRTAEPARPAGLEIPRLACLDA